MHQREGAISTSPRVVRATFIATQLGTCQNLDSVVEIHIFTKFISKPQTTESIKNILMYVYKLDMTGVTNGPFNNPICDVSPAFDQPKLKEIFFLGLCRRLSTNLYRIQVVRAPKNCGPRGVWTAWTACPAGGTRESCYLDTHYLDTQWIPGSRPILMIPPPVSRIIL